MQRRHVSEEDIEQALRQVIRRTAGAPGTVWIHGHAVGGRILKVCVRIADDVVITVAWPDE
jgi:hypothetical protein